MSTGEGGNPKPIGYCWWCNEDLHSFQEAEAHIYDGSGTCPLFNEMRREPSTPPVSEILLLEDSGTTLRRTLSNRKLWKGL
jgi:hypothetical protein